MKFQLILKFDFSSRRVLRVNHDHDLTNHCAAVHQPNPPASWMRLLLPALAVVLLLTHAIGMSKRRPLASIPVSSNARCSDSPAGVVRDVEPPLGLHHDPAVDASKPFDQSPIKNARRSLFHSLSL